MPRPIYRKALVRRIGIWGACGLAVGLVVAMAIPKHRPETELRPPFDRIDEILAARLQQADEEANTGLQAGVTPIHRFFDEARSGTPAFAEDVLGWQSKWTMARDYVTGSDTHQQFIEERFATHVFAPDELERLLKSSVAGYVQHLGDVESQLLVRIKADLDELPADELPTSLQPSVIQQRLDQALQEAVAAAEADFKGAVGREIVSLIAGEIVSVAGTQLAISTGILSVGAGTSWITAGAGIVLSVIVDYVVTWVYESVYDPTGEIVRRVDDVLTELETLLVDGNGSASGLESRLRDYAAHRSAMRNEWVRKALLVEP